MVFDKNIISILQVVLVVTSVFAIPIYAQKNEPKIEVKTVFSPFECSRKVQLKDFVRYQYYGMLEDGTYFDSSHNRGYSYDTYVGTGWLIPGMDAGLVGMCINEHRIIKIPPELAYGETGSGAIPGNATIYFNTILLDVWNENDEVKVTTTFEPATCNRRLEVSDYIRYHYNGTLANGKVFHTSYEEGTTYNTYVGQGWLIKGMDKGLIGSCVGERRRIQFPPHLGYGERGDGKNIPASASLTFDVEVIDFHNPDDEVVITITHKVENCQRQLESGDYIRYHYNGTFMDGTLFDSSYQRNHTYNTYVGKQRLIPGVDRGLIGVCMGERRNLVIPPHLAYGEPGVEDRIPGSAVLIFDVHIIDFHNPKDDVTVEVMTRVEEDARQVEDGDYVVCDFTLKLMDDSILDVNDDEKWGVYVGHREVPEGLERGLIGMKVGEERKIVVPPHIGYGESGMKDYVPGSAVLVYILKCKEIHEGVPKGSLLKWKEQKKNEEVEELFKLADADSDSSVDAKELTVLLENAVKSEKLIFAPHLSSEDVLRQVVPEKSLSNVDFSEFLKKTGGIVEELKDEL